MINNGKRCCHKAQKLADFELFRLQFLTIFYPESVAIIYTLFDIFKCEVRDFKKDGGSCLTGESEIFIHCSTKNRLEPGVWSKWYGDSQWCDPKKDFFKQKFRYCRDSSNKPALCPGSWLMVCLLKHRIYLLINILILTLKIQFQLYK